MYVHVYLLFKSIKKQLFNFFLKTYYLYSVFTVFVNCKKRKHAPYFIR